MNNAEERADRIERIARRLLSAASALETERWDLLMADTNQAAREAKALALLDKQAKEEKEP